MGFFNFFTGNLDSHGSQLPEIFPFNVNQSDFIKADIVSTYVKILTDTVERTHGISPELEPLLWDNCVQSEASIGLVTLLSQAMTDMADLYLVYVPSVKVLRKATSEEEQKIKIDYEKSGDSSVGVFISFKKYKRTEVLRIYSIFEYCVLASLHKTLNLSKAVQVKISDLRASIALVDSSVAKAQGKEVADALAAGKDVLIDVKDMIETAQPDTSSSEKAIQFLDAKRAFILGLPMSYISGLQTTGIGSTGEADMRAVERGLKQYFVSILRPTLKALFGIETEFKSQDFRQLTSALEALKTFDLVSDENISKEAKQELVARMFELNIKKEKKLIAKQAKEVEAEPKEASIGFPR